MDMVEKLFPRKSPKLIFAASRMLFLPFRILNHPHPAFSEAVKAPAPDYDAVHDLYA